jgi:3-deoxy-7-phosphoheptulonate synthase
MIACGFFYYEVKMEKIQDVNIRSFSDMVTPEVLSSEIPVTEQANRTVFASREVIKKILSKEDKRLLIVIGPCSIHDETAAIEYAERLNSLRKEVQDKFFLAMRVYFEKPRTNIGWKGMINDPWLDGSYDIESGLRKARRLLLQITGMGLPTATEMLDPITPQYIADLICWSAIGARTTESQTHREMVSGLSMPVGLKNGTDGDLMVAINGIVAAGSPQQFIGIDFKGRTSIVRTNGNPWTHIVLRGGNRPNYDSVSIKQALNLLKKSGLNQSVMVDCSHDNSGKDYTMQPLVWQDVINQRLDGNDSITGLMVESNLFEGNQPNTGDQSTLKYGVSITDACISWETTEGLILSTYEHMKQVEDVVLRYKCGKQENEQRQIKQHS